LLHHPEEGQLLIMGPNRQSGFSLIEIMISILVLAILLFTAVPTFSTWIQNTQIRTASEGLVNGLQAARNEAIRRNQCMQLQIVNNTGWELKLCNDTGSPPLQSRPSGEGSPNAVATTKPDGTDTVSFNSLGRVLPTNNDGSLPFTEIDITNPTMNQAEMRKLQINVPVGGAFRLCDPSPLLTTSDPRACPAP
jgi:type IV fimbrial biogenesis protein FimT